MCVILLSLLELEYECHGPGQEKLSLMLLVYLVFWGGYFLGGYLLFNCFRISVCFEGERLVCFFCGEVDFVVLLRSLLVKSVCSARDSG